ncbi:MAG TPA: hypothetical protein VFH99_00745 [Candidatus Saccharimonadales bacterium]|nr:hypothetical protein [Candidatus Saccharimonadales bacterium]
MCDCTHVYETHNGVKVVFIPESPGVLVVEFDKPLYKEPRTSDFEIYANAPYATLTRIIGDSRNSRLLTDVLNATINDIDCVDKANVRLYRLTLHYSRAVDVNYMAEVIRIAMHESER